MTEPMSIDETMVPGERRRSADRRKGALRAVLVGHVNPRRHGPRRSRDGSIVSTDWHEARWLAVAVLTLLLSIADAVLTLTLLEHGALEANPVMAVLLRGSAAGFAAVKIGLTAGGILLLTLLARVRAFGRLPVGILLYGVLAAYVGLVVYELRLLQGITD